jgi:predicted PurR-regulated permease PerM
MVRRPSRTDGGAAAGVALVLFPGLYLAAAPEVCPEVHRCGLLALVSPSRRARADALLGVLPRTLQRWLVSKVVRMALTGTLTGTGLAVLGIPLALAPRSCWAWRWDGWGCSWRR